MAPSSTRFAASRREILAARDARQELVDRHAPSVDGGMVMLTLGVPGLEKTPPGADALFAWARREFTVAFPGARQLHEGQDVLGPFALWAVAADPAEVKRRCIAIEEAGPAARLVDLDVYAAEKGPVDRASLLLPARACLCCAADARECIRARRHGLDALAARARSLLAEVDSLGRG